MAGLTAVASSVGAGVSHGRIQNDMQAVQLKDQERPPSDMGAAALLLIQRALVVSGTTQHDLDVLA